MSHGIPSLSIVTCSRNDDHGHRLLERCALFVRGLLWQCRTHRFKAELIMVEWNPPEGKPLLKEVLPLPQEGDWLTVRFIVVPKAAHQSVSKGGRMPLHQMIAKNVGIRRAKAPFILCTNNDLLFSSELFGHLAAATLEEGTFYRANRRDVPASIDYNLGIPELLAYCPRHVTKLYGKHHLLPEMQEVEHYNHFKRLLCMGSRVRQRLFPKERDFLLDLDLHACGDFTLMSRGDWMDIRGYLEAPVYPVFIDSLALIAAKLQRKKQVILPPECCSYHINHGNGWVPRRERLLHIKHPVERMLKRLELEHKPAIEWMDVEYLCMTYSKGDVPLELNGGDWGFPDREFEEYVFDANGKSKREQQV